MRTANGVLCMQLRAAKRKNANHKALPLSGSPFSGCPLISQGRPRPLRFCFVARPACMRSHFWRGAEQDLISRGRPRPLRGTPSEPPPLIRNLARFAKFFRDLLFKSFVFHAKTNGFLTFHRSQKLRDLHQVLPQRPATSRFSPSFFPRFVSLCSVTLQPRRMTPVLTFMRNG